MSSVHAPCSFFFFNDTATTEIYTLSLHDALPISDRSVDLRSRRRGTLGPARLDELHLPFALHRVGRHLEVDGARPPGPELLDRLVGGARDVGDLENAPPPLRDRRDRVEDRKRTRLNLSHS